LNSGLHACWMGALPLEPCIQPQFYFFYNNFIKIYFCGVKLTHLRC
jgi:hypothetical protein